MRAFLALLSPVMWLMSSWALPVHAQEALIPATGVSLGEVRQGQVVDHSFLIGNAGDAPLALEVLGISQPGITVHFRSEVPPGEEISFRAEWDTSLIQGPRVAEIGLRLNDPNQPLVVFQLDADVVPPIEILPVPAVFVSAYRDERSVRTLEILNHQDRPMEIREVRGPEWAEVDWRTTEEGHAFEVDVEILASQMDAGFIDDWIEIVWADEGAVKRLPIHAFVKNDVYVNPEVAEFGVLDLDDIRLLPGVHALTTQTFLLKKRNALLEVRSATSDLPFVQVSFTPPRDADTYQFSVTIDRENAVRGSFEGTIAIETDDPDFPELHVPVSGELR